MNPYHYQIQSRPQRPAEGVPRHIRRIAGLWISQGGVLMLAGLVWLFLGGGWPAWLGMFAALLWSVAGMTWLISQGPKP